ncbi:hypothetical protein SDC9_125217 [bioreactor metagenome]|uniref:Uncharacterized protein n=1 Tax=bioreactor metagenome TaxID=1076179 RepID=A0A645CMG4_9ZZZZ
MHALRIHQATQARRAEGLERHAGIRERAWLHTAEQLAAGQHLELDGDVDLVGLGGLAAQPGVEQHAALIGHMPGHGPLRAPLSAQQTAEPVGVDIGRYV